jgi:hypothetical protein
MHFMSAVITTLPLSFQSTTGSVVQQNKKWLRRSLRPGLQLPTFGAVLQAGAPKTCPGATTNVRAAAQGRVFLLLARRKESVEIEEQPLDRAVGR